MLATKEMMRCRYASRKHMICQLGQIRTIRSQLFHKGRLLYVWSHGLLLYPASKSKIESTANQKVASTVIGGEGFAVRISVGLQAANAVKLAFYGVAYQEWDKIEGVRGFGSYYRPRERPSNLEMEEEPVTKEKYRVYRASRLFGLGLAQRIDKIYWVDDRSTCCMWLVR